MSTEVRWRRGTAAQHSNFTGALSEITHDTTSNNLRIHDGSTAGGHATLMDSELGKPLGIAPLDGNGNVPESHLGYVMDIVDGHKAIANGIASLDDSGQVPASQLGNVPAQAEFEARTKVITSRVPAALSFVRTAGFSVAGDGGGALYKRVAAEPPHAGKVQSADGAWWEMAADIITVKMFGAKGDGIVDDTAAIQNAINYTTETKRTLFFTAGTYMVSGLTVYAYSRLTGEGRATVIKLISGSNADVIKGNNSDALWGMTNHHTATGYCYHTEIANMIIDGGVTSFTGAASGSGIAIWGSRLRIWNIDIKNCADYGLRTDYYDNDHDASQPWYEASFYVIRIFNCGKHGWYCAGPHDAQIADITIIDASRLGNSLYDGLHITPNMSGNFVDVHVSNAMSMTVRHRYAGHIGGACRFSGGTTFEGAWEANMLLKASGCQFAADSTWYVPWNGCNIKIAGGSAFNTIRGTLGDARPGDPNPWGIEFTDYSSSKISFNTFDLIMTGQNKGLISFGAGAGGDGGKNIFNILSYNAPGTGIFGMPNTANGTVLKITKNDKNYPIDSQFQSRISYIGANSTATITYDFPYQSSPAVNTTPRTSSTLTTPLIVESVSDTQCVIKNNNSFGMDICVSTSPVTGGVS